MDRKLDGMYFRIYRNNEWCNVCFSDLTSDEMDTVLKGKKTVFLKSLAKKLANCIREMGDQLDLTRE